MSVESIYAAKSTTYFAQCRDELLSFIPEGQHAVLELGCGAGATGQALKRSGRAKFVLGIEISADAANAASRVLDEVLVDNVDILDWAALRERHLFDYVIATDVLEHLVDPWRVVKECVESLNPGGHFIAIVPNVRNLKVILPLIFNGRWDYQEWGLLDKGHIRFFTRATVRSLFENAGMKVENIAAQISPRSKSGVVNRFTLGRFEDFIAPHYVVIARKASEA